MTDKPRPIRNVLKFEVTAMHMVILSVALMTTVAVFVMVVGWAVVEHRRVTIRSDTIVKLRCIEKTASPTCEPKGKK